jgi:hypothetical protein
MPAMLTIYAGTVSVDKPLNLIPAFCLPFLLHLCVIRPWSHAPMGKTEGRGTGVLHTAVVFRALSAHSRILHSIIV